MKQYGINGLGTGKLGNMVFSVRNGQQIVRQYNPIVANPQTDAQVASRSRLKLMSQLAAILAPVIAMEGVGLKSKRNEFISRNYDLSDYENGVASIALAQIQLTKSSVALPSLNVARVEGTGITASLAEDSHLAFDRIVYVMLTKQGDGSFSLYDTQVISEAGDNGAFAATLSYTAAPLVVLAYGIRANDADTLTRFDNIVATDGMDVAAIGTRQRDLLANVTLSVTRGVVLNVGADSGSDVQGNGTLSIAVVPSGAGTVTGAGSYPLGSQVTVTATAATGYQFDGWRKNGTYVSTSASYSFTLDSNTSLQAAFSEVSQGGPATD